MEFKDFRLQYIEQYPSSVPTAAKIISAYPRFMKWGTLGMFFSAALISGVHTVPTVFDGMETSIDLIVRQVVSLLSFVAYELAIFISAYARMLTKSLTPLLTLIIAVSVAIMCNIHSTSKAMDALKGTDQSSGIFALIVGIGAPLLALAAGEFYVQMHGSDRKAALQAATDLQNRNEIFDQGIRDAWAQHLQVEQARAAQAAEREHQLALEAEDRQRKADAAERARIARDERREQERSRESSHEVHEPTREQESSPAGRVNLHEVAKLVHERGEQDWSIKALREKYGISQGGASNVLNQAAQMNGHSAPAEVQS